MSPQQIEIVLVASVVSVACALPGVFLVLRRVALMSDAISHAILLGIVLAFFATEDLASPLLLLGASLTGLILVALVELLRKTQLVKEDAAIGLVFPAMFSLGAILISRYAGNVHLDIDSVLLGELAFAPFDRFLVGDVDMGPKGLYLGLGILMLNFIFIILFFKELKLTTFDAGHAAALGFAPAVLHYSLMALVSVTAVGAFDAVGSILVVALMIVPAATSYLLTHRLETMLWLSAAFALTTAVLGYALASSLDTNIAGAMATVTGLQFAGVLLVAPEQGLIAGVVRRKRQRWEFALETLVVHIQHHLDSPESDVECRSDHLTEHFKWSPGFAREIVNKANQQKLVTDNSGRLHLTQAGHEMARNSILR